MLLANGSYHEAVRESKPINKPLKEKIKREDHFDSVIDL